MIPYLVSFIAPTLLLLLVCQSVVLRFVDEAKRPRADAIILAASALIAVVPFLGMPMARIVAGLNANFSVTTIALLASTAIANSTRKTYLDDDARLAAWLTILALGILLYPATLGLTDCDPYEAGWGFSWLHVVACAAAIALASRGNRFSIVLVAAAGAHALGLLESTNLWDYLLDPFVFIAAVVALTIRLVRHVRAPRSTSTATACHVKSGDGQ